MIPIWRAGTPFSSVKKSHARLASMSSPASEGGGTFEESANPLDQRKISALQWNQTLID